MVTDEYDPTSPIVSREVMVLVAGMVPLYRRGLLSVLPLRAKSAYKLLAALSKLSRRDLKLPREIIYRYICSGMDHMEVVHVVGLFGALPTRVLNTRLSLDEPQPSCPVTYVVLTQDRILPSEVQHRMAERFTEIEVVEVDAGHQVMLSKPKELADILLSYA